MTGPVTVAPGGVRVAIRVSPRASRNTVAGLAVEADGSVSLLVRVTAPPEDGKANAAVLKLLARTWKLPKSALGIASGAGSRRKTISVAGDPAARAVQLDKWIGTTFDG
ncbi:MAG: DUF167 domain-containing protein [Acidobacteria bacterium]|nr:DUF167 domain-containing protein [Acidobacteriota bacterium]